MKIERNIWCTQAKNCWGCIQVGRKVIYIGRKRGYAWRLEIFTPLHRLRFSKGSRVA